jgi:hypothetical protein
MAGRIVVFLLVVFRPLLRLLGSALKIIYKIFFSWWLNPALDRWARESFAKEIRLAFPFLFTEYEGKLVPSPRPEVQSPEMEYICIATTNLVFEFSRWHNENYEIRVSPAFAPKDSYDLIDALNAVETAGKPILAPTIDNWPSFARLLEPRFLPLETAFSSESFAKTKQRLAQLQLGKVSV